MFIAATKDERIGRLIRGVGRYYGRQKLPAGGYATPATYGQAGTRQFVVVGPVVGKMGTRSGDAYVAFALPK